MTTTQTMSIHRALSELKTLNDRIPKAIHEADFIATDRKSAQKINGLSIEDYEKTIQAGFDKAVSLIERRNRLKDAIVQSNAITEVVVAGERMTVAKAIERKSSISYEEKMLSTMIAKRRMAINKLTMENESLPNRLEDYLTAILGNKEHAKKEEVELHTKSFMERNEYVLINPLQLDKRIEEWEERVSSFKAEVDAVLSESNAITTITI
ncbi:putative coiled-coil protein SlyX [Sporosarcina luteola]|nr:putative coiled-coil protein SlyX [Sporosarcina luteola]